MYLYLAEDETLYLYDGTRLEQWSSEVDLRDLLYDDEAYLSAMAALGEEAVIDIGRRA